MVADSSIHCALSQGPVPPGVFTDPRGGTGHPSGTGCGTQRDGFARNASKYAIRAGRPSGTGRDAKSSGKRVGQQVGHLPTTKQPHEQTGNAA